MGYAFERRGADEARKGWRSGRKNRGNGSESPEDFFGNRKRGCAATSNPSFCAKITDTVLVPVIFYAKKRNEPERRGPAWATLLSAAERMKRERVGAAVEKIEEMGRRAPKIFSGTARGVAKQLQIPPSAPK